MLSAWTHLPKWKLLPCMTNMLTHVHTQMWSKEIFNFLVLRLTTLTRSQTPRPYWQLHTDAASPSEAVWTVHTNSSQLGEFSECNMNKWAESLICNEKYSFPMASTFMPIIQNTSFLGIANQWAEDSDTQNSGEVMGRWEHESCLVS